ncbi:MAG: hypothetical protein KDB27_06370, partial [Planctomycetales bacterium]|nr:hypothetical protein [Planctomycetales bacterium]
MSEHDKFRISTQVILAIKQSNVTFADIYRLAGKSQSMWRRATGQAGDGGVILSTFLAFTDAINQLMGWEKSPEPMCHPDDRERLLNALRQMAGEFDPAPSADPAIPTDSVNPTTSADESQPDSDDISPVPSPSSPRDLFRRKSYGFAATAVLVTLAVVFISLQPRQPPGAEQTENGRFHTQVVAPA